MTNDILKDMIESNMALTMALNELVEEVKILTKQNEEIIEKLSTSC